MKYGISLRSSRLLLADVTAIVTLAGGSVQAETEWKKQHPRRAEVNHRLAKQNARIHEEHKEGELNATQAQALHQEDHAIRQEERADASQHGGHITKSEQKSINQQLNGVSKRIPE